MYQPKSSQMSTTHPLTTVFVTIPAVLATIVALGALAMLGWREIAVLPPTRFFPVRMLQEGFPTVAGDNVPALIAITLIGMGVLVLAAIASFVAENLQDSTAKKESAARA